MQNGPFSLTQCVELAGSALPIVTTHLTVYLREVLTLLLRKENIFEQLLASERYAEVIKRWITSKQHQQLLGQAVMENLAGRALHLCGACPGDHGIGDSCTEWSDIQELMDQLDEFTGLTQAANEHPPSKQENTVPWEKMRVLDRDEKKTNRTREKKKEEFGIPSFIKEGLEKLHIPLPQGINGLANTTEQIQRMIPQLISAAVDSFPCRLCSERLTGDSATLPLPDDHENVYPMATTAEQINLYGERVGAWKVLLSDLAMEKVKKLIDEGKFPQVEYNLRELAQGRGLKRRSRQVPHGSKADLVPVIPLHFSPLPGEIFILWQVDVGYYDELTARKQFGQTIKVWNMVNREQLLPAVDWIINLQQHYKEDIVDICKKDPIKLPDGSYVPQRWEILPVYNSTSQPQRATKKSQVLVDILGKFTNVTDSFLKALLRAKGYEEFPFDLSQEEMQIVNHSKTSSLILGRSGTGKTTCLLFQLLGKHQAREGISHTNRIKQLLLTRSPHLAAKLQLYVRNLIDTASGTSSTWIPPDEEPDEILKLRDVNFPFVCTYDKFLGMLEKSMQNADRQNFNEGDHAKSKNKPNQKSNLKPTPVIDFDIFKYEYWGCLSASAPQGCPPELIFAEIMGVIRGSRICAKDLRALSREEYVPRESKVSPAFPGVADREKAFDVYERYERLKKQRGQIDDLDRVMDVLKYIMENPSFASQLRRCFEAIYVDEIQDLRCVDIVLLFKAVFNARGIHLAGDTAQCISKDSVFRFPEVRAAFFDEHESTAAFLKQNVAKPRQFMLARNYRSHQGILSFASWVMQVLWSFPETIDKLNPEVGQIDGPVPIIFAGFDCSVLSSRMIGVTKMNDKVANFGAEQVILVRDDDSKVKLQTDIGEVALVLTILQSKGMEFDDVLIYDFFGGSGLGSSYRCLHLLAQEPRGEFDSRKHAQLYVAVTRARKQLWFMETSESALDSIVKALTENNCLRLVDIARKKDEQSAEKLKALRAGGSVDPAQWKKRATQLFHQMNYQAAIFGYNKAGDTEGAERAEAYDCRREGRSRKFRDIDGSTRYFEKAIELFRGIDMLEDAAECYEQIGKHDKAAEIWKNKGQLQRAAKIYELGLFFQAASECYDVDGDFEKAVEVLQRGDKFDDLIIYLSRNPDKLDTNVRQRYSRLCNILLKQGRVSSDLRVATINLLGSEAEKVDFFIEFDLVDDLCSYYAANENWMELYETHVENGNVPEAVKIVKEHNLINQVEPETFKQVLNYVIVSSMWTKKVVLEVGFFDTAKEIAEDFHDVIWMKDHISEWKIVFDILNVTNEDLGDPQGWWEMERPTDDLLCMFGNISPVLFRFQKHLEVSTTLQLNQSSTESLTCNKTMSKTRNEALNLTQSPSWSTTRNQTGSPVGSPVQNRAQYSTQKLEPPDLFLASLYLACGIYRLGRHEKAPLKQYWSKYCPPVSAGNSDDTVEAVNFQAMAWAKSMFADAMDFFDARAKALITQEFPKRCTPFLLRGLCMKRRTGQCSQLHERLTTETCSGALGSLILISGLYAHLTKTYMRRVMSESFQRNFLGRRRYWLQQLEEKIIFVTPLDQSGQAIMDLRHLLAKGKGDNVAGNVAGCWEDLLLFRMKKNWYEMHTFTGILEQCQIAFFLGPRTTTIFARTLMRKITSILSRHPSSDHPLISTKEALQALERARGLHGFLNATKPVDKLLLSNLHPILSVVEFGVTAFLCAMNPGNAVVLPSSWAFLHLPDIIRSPLELDAAEPRDKDRMECIIPLRDVIISFCIIFEKLDNEAQLPLQFKGRHKSPAVPKRRIFDLLLTVMLNLSHYPSRPRGIDSLSARISKTLALVAPPNWASHTMESPAKLREGVKATFSCYAGKNTLQVVTLNDKTTAPAYLKGFVDASAPVMKVSECIKNRWDDQFEQDVQDSSAAAFHSVESSHSDEYSPVETNSIIFLQRQWRRRRKILEERHKAAQSVEGNFNMILFNHCQSLLRAKRAGETLIPKYLHVGVRYLVFTHGYRFVVKEDLVKGILLKMREKLRFLFENKELRAADLEELDALRGETWKAEKSARTNSGHHLFSRLELKILPLSSDTLSVTEATLEDALGRMTEMYQVASELQGRLNALFAG
ncbi:hypothetical protein N7481_007406 [Penicillium waksmanii]|uniref:uncharacterized protein n=1 Tax=Penicillium waksmanii TaxID=69791 RepID=UPI002546E305|nr:uncharacterized protein N7481_007406 [Penicillium waksmanii]KAJ5980108.1 hypothetical protein N7481_007406 [Penicillium waksmanii]